MDLALFAIAAVSGWIASAFGWASDHWALLLALYAISMLSDIRDNTAATRRAAEAQRWLAEQRSHGPLE